MELLSGTLGFWDGVALCVGRRRGRHALVERVSLGSAGEGPDATPEVVMRALAMDETEHVQTEAKRNGGAAGTTPT